MKSSAPRNLVNVLFRNGYNKRQRVFLFAIALVILSIVALSYFCPENLCHQEKSSSNPFSSSVPLISTFLPYSDFANDQAASSFSQLESGNVDRILERIFGFDFDRYKHLRQAKTWQVNFEMMIASPEENAFHIRGIDVVVFLHMQKTGMFLTIFK